MQTREIKRTWIWESLGMMANMERHDPRTSSPSPSHPVADGDKEVEEYGSKVVTDYAMGNTGADGDIVVLRKWRKRGSTVRSTGGRRTKWHDM